MQATTIEFETTGELALFDDLASAAAGMRWHVLHTRSRQEKALAQDMDARGIRHYLPLVPQVHYYGRRKIATRLPLFSGYVFLLGTPEQAYLADRTGRVARIMPVSDQNQLSRELRNIDLALRTRQTIELYPNLYAGQRVEVRAGPLKGVQGLIERVGGQSRLLLQVTMLGKSVSLEIDGSLLVLLR
jgi:transcriptional antiterminator RfaH